MAHDDIWDDSALIASWNEALAEYKVSQIARMFPSPLPIVVHQCMATEN
jgi:hypothetical protein